LALGALSFGSSALNQKLAFAKRQRSKAFDVFDSPLQSASEAKREAYHYNKDPKTRNLKPETWNQKLRTEN
jgi:hypothetical protein